MTTEQIILHELVFAKDKMEQANAILAKTGCVISEDLSEVIKQLKAEIVERQVA